MYTSAIVQNNIAYQKIVNIGCLKHLNKYCYLFNEDNL